MERPFPIEDLVDRVGNRYAIVVAVAKRARQLKSGSKPLVEIESKNPTTIALHEISAGLVTIHEIEPTEPEMPAPSSPELEHAERLSQAVAELGEEDADEDEQEQEAASALTEQMSDDEDEDETDPAAQSDDQEDVPDDEEDADEDEQEQETASTLTEQMPDDEDEDETDPAAQSDDQEDVPDDENDAE